MSKLSIEIPDTEGPLATASISTQGTGAQLIQCLGFLIHAVAETTNTPAPLLVAMVAANIPGMKRSIKEQVRIDLDTLERGRKSGHDK